MKKTTSIIIAAVILGISFIVVQSIKQNSIEKQQVLELEQERQEQLAEKEFNNILLDNSEKYYRRECIENCKYDIWSGYWKYIAYLINDTYSGKLQKILDNAPANTTSEGIILVLKESGYIIKEGWVMEMRHFPTQETCEKSCVNNYLEHSIIEQIE